MCVWGVGGLWLRDATRKDSGDQNHLIRFLAGIFYDSCLLFLHLQGEMVQWTVFLISYWGDQIGQKVKKICDWWVKVFLLYRIAVSPKCLD